MASSFSGRVPLKETVAIERCMFDSCEIATSADRMSGAHQMTVQQKHGLGVTELFSRPTAIAIHNVPDS
jgi:hypothetical protein